MNTNKPTLQRIAAVAVACALVGAALSVVSFGAVAQDGGMDARTQTDIPPSTPLPNDEREPNDEPANATRIQEGVVVTGEVKEDPKDRVDVYAFEAKKGQHIVVNVTGLEDAPRPTQLTLSLHGPAYARGNDSTLDEIYATLGTTTNKLTATAPVTGTYYVEVANEAAMGSSGRYAVSVEVSGSGNTQAGPTKINSCTVIDQPGRYVLTEDIEDSTVDQCIEIYARDVVLDGAGHTIDGVDGSATGGIVVFGRDGAFNVSVTNVTVTDWGTGITYEATTGEIRDSVVASNSRGIAFTYGAGGIVVANTAARGNDFAGFYVQDSSGNLFVDDTASDNGWAYASVSSDGPSPVPSENNTVKNLALDSATVSFESKDIKLGAVESLPTSPTDLSNVGGYVNATSSGNDDDAFLALSVHYTDAAIANVNESTLRLYVFSDGNWSPVPDSTVNTKNNIVFGNVTALANPTVLAPFGGDAGKTEQPSDDGDAPPDDDDDASSDNGGDAPSDDGDAPPNNGSVPPDDGDAAPPDDGDVPPDDGGDVLVCEAGSTDEILGENDEDDDGDGAIDEDDEDNDGPSNDDDDGDGAIDEDDECDDGDDGSDEFNSNAEDDDDGDGAFDEDDESDSGNSDDVDNDGDGAIDEDDESDTDD